AAISTLIIPAAMAGAPTVATVQNASGETGSVRVFRAGVSEIVSEGDELQLGDRIVTRPGGSVELQFDGCSATIDRPDTLVITENACGIVEARFGQTPTPAQGSGAGAGGGAGGGAAGGGAAAGGAAAGGGIGTGAVVGIGVGVAAVGGGIAAGVSGGGDDDEPASP
ncbi:MAG: hypothetical protein AAFV54_12360, partial [Pseudomonadota bacterium]